MSIPAPATDRAEAARLLAEARHLYLLAEVVQARRRAGTVDSALLAHRALSLVLRLVVRLHGEDPPDSFATLSERARAIAASESLTPEDLTDDLRIVEEMADRLKGIDVSVTPADDRRYDRAFMRCREWFDASQAYLDQRLPAPAASWKPRIAVAASVTVALVLGFLAGRHAPGQRLTVSQAPPTAVSATAPGFIATYYKDTVFNQVVLTAKDERIDFDWGEEGPAGVDQPDHFSVRWQGTLDVTEAGKYTFHLTSDDGSRLFIGDRLVIDNWGLHSAITSTAVVELTAGAHPIKVEYFDKIGAALVRLKWSSDKFEPRPITGADLR